MTIPDSNDLSDSTPGTIKKKRRRKCLLQEEKITKIDFNKNVRPKERKPIADEKCNFQFFH